MDDFENMSNNQIIAIIKEMMQEHEAIKNKMLKEYEKLEAVERRFAKANKILNKRRKGEK